MNMVATLLFWFVFLLGDVCFNALYDFVWHVIFQIDPSDLGSYNRKWFQGVV